MTHILYPCLMAMHLDLPAQLQAYKLYESSGCAQLRGYLQPTVEDVHAIIFG
jgi:hypothetical protein